MTKDGSETLFNPSYRDYYHSTAGALAEARIKYIEPCRIKELAAISEVSLLDIGFGLGYNLGVALDEIMSAGGKLLAVSLEMDEDILSKLSGMDPKITSYHAIKKLAQKRYYSDEHANLRLIMGNAVQTIKEINMKFDAVFHDPFAPTRNPELWTKEFFRDAKRLMKPRAVLATYSCARHVRDNLRWAGFLVKDGPVFGRRGPSTIAINKQVAQLPE